MGIENESKTRLLVHGYNSLALIKTRKPFKLLKINEVNLVSLSHQIKLDLNYICFVRKRV